MTRNRWKTEWMSVVTTAVCLLVAIPTGYAMARSSERMKGLLLLLVVIPFWTNFLIRIFAWKVMLHPEGLVKTALLSLRLIQPDALLMYNEGAVLIVLIYTYLPFAILPIYAAIEKFDFSLFEAALDLGCSRLGGFVRVLLPGISRGLMTASLVVFIPAAARQPGLAHAFINFMHRPEVAAANILFVQYRCPNLAAYELLDPEVRADETIFLPDEVMKRCEVIQDLGTDNAKFVKIWDAIRAAE